MKKLITIFLLFNSFFLIGQIEFDRVKLTGLSDSPESLHGADYDEDGDIDIMVASSNDDKVKRFRNDGDLEFASQTLSAFLDGANRVKSHDLYSDGDLDIIATGFEPGNYRISWSKNQNNSLGFMATLVSINNEAFQDFVIFDIDSDGDQDIVTVEFSTAAGPGSLSLWETMI